MHGMELIERVVPGIYREPDQPAALDVVGDHGFGHRAPAQTRRQQGMLGAKIGKAAGAPSPEELDVSWFQGRRIAKVATALRSLAG
jgi:hypothetical protein